MGNGNLAGLYTGSFRENWDLPLFSDYEGSTFTYKEVAQSIQNIRTIFEKVGIKAGDRVALYGRNSSNWAKVFLACLAHRVVAIPILPDFKPEIVHNIVNHSEAKFLFVSKNIFNNLNAGEMPNLEVAVALEDNSLLISKRDNLEEIIKECLSNAKPIKKEDFSFAPMQPEDLLVLSYTSGSAGFSKGVMIPERSIYSNTVYAREHMPIERGSKIVSFLPMAHVFGLLFDFLWPTTIGCHVTFLNRTPSPQILIKAFAEIKPRLILSVPLVIEKIYKKSILPTLQKPLMKVLLAIPGINNILYSKIRAKLIKTFGGNFYEIVIGGAAFSVEVEKFFRKIKFPFTTGYGMTECGPLISYKGWKESRHYSAGQLVDRMQIRIESSNPYKIVGEIQVKGDNVMLGYLNNEEANRNIFTPDGWMKTGDLGIIDKDNFVYIKGRSKNMLLGPSGQNIYPEELETRLSGMAYVQECVIVQRDNKLVALVYPDKAILKAEGLSEDKLGELMDENKAAFNQQVASYEQLSRIELVDQEFEKTPKQNIKRFMYV